MAPARVSPVAVSIRLASLDAYRGFVMLLMMAEVLRLRQVAQALPESGVWKFLAAQQSHVEWVGCSLHDLIQPSFSFLVGVALPFSIASRSARGHTKPAMLGHALWRALLLIMLGVALRSIGRPALNWTFEDTLTQIGLGYGFLFALGFRPVRDQWVAFALILTGAWAAFATHPLPAAGFDYRQVGVAPSWLQLHGLGGFAAHWQKNSNLAAAFDTWFLNLFPREHPFLFHGGGYATLSFVPTLATMVLGLLAGGVLRSERTARKKIRWFVVAGVIALAAGAGLGWLGVCPVVKRIWTPSWVLFSGGWCCLLLAGFYAAVDVARQRRWVFPLVVIGKNSIAAYLIAHVLVEPVRKMWGALLGAGAFRIFGAAYEPLLMGSAILLVLWALLWLLYRLKWFLKI
jgi:heparan-alpha-glucosaminide N-acetyltransferase